MPLNRFLLAAAVAGRVFPALPARAGGSLSADDATAAPAGLCLFEARTRSASPGRKPILDDAGCGPLPGRENDLPRSSRLTPGLDRPQPN